jgi:gliding motility-associated-like protein
VPTIVVAPDKPVLCAGIPVPLTVSGAASYEWSPPEGLSDTTGNNVIADPTVTTTYMILGVSDSGCAGVVTVTVTVDSMPKASFAYQIPNVCTPKDVQFMNTSTGAVNYLWDFGDGNTGIDADPVHTYDKPGTYSVTLTATNADGCEDVISNSVIVPASEEPLAIANAFTPGVGGINSYITPQIICTNLSNYTFRIYNRWGQLLFQTNDPSQGWDGRFNGQMEQVDVYDYYIEFTCGNCNLYKKGNITLLK